MAGGDGIGKRHQVSVAILAYTINAARAMKQEANIGSIEPGKAADFALVDRDVLTVPAEQMRDTKVLSTMVAGKWVYRAKE